METQGLSFETEFQSVVLGLHRLVKIMNYLISFPEKNIHLAAKQKTDAEAMLKDVTHDTRQLKFILVHYQQEVSIPNLNTKQNKMEEFMASFDNQKVKETDSKGPTPKKKPKRTTKTSGMKTRLRTLTEMAIDIGRQEKESSHIRDLVSIVDIVEDLTHSVALTSAMDRRFNRHIPADHESESDGFGRTTQRESNGIGPINHAESGGVRPTNQSETDSYRNTNPDSDSISSTIIPIRQVQSDGIRTTHDTESNGIIPIHHVQSEGIRPTQNIELNDTGPIPDIQSDGVRPTYYNGIPPYNTELDDFRFAYDTESDGKPINDAESYCTCIRPTYYTESNGISSVHQADPYIGTGRDSVSGQTTVRFSHTSLTATYSQIKKHMNTIQRYLKLQLLRWSGGSRFKLFLLIVLIIVTVLAIFIQYCFLSNEDRCLCVERFLSSFLDIDCCPDMVL
ncbi:uncharacterized protein LOC121390594 [Gigantopelta aegis]|uniref:uncharacterized protein LOC121390594 n=1 Tax=Gigantopelta aegis TaxID=1735272 RepID=UPI001B888948|nr:uncharacterized protein LOC121390594 [Gigantopelta aegis]